MYRVWSVAHNTFIEAIRDRVLYSMFLFAALMILSTLVFASISAGQYNKIVKDLGLTAISVIGIMISVFLGMGLVYKEIEKKTVYNIFSKPIRRYEFILGKYLGLGSTLLLLTIGMSVILLLVVLYTEITHGGMIEFYYGGHYYAQFFKAMYFQYLEFLVLIAIALVFSSFTTPIMSVLFTFLTLAMGKFSSDIKLFAQEVESPLVGYVTDFIYVVIPHLDSFNVRHEAVYGGEINWKLIFYTTGYAVLYTLALLKLSIVIFNRREFK
ncbi:MAG: ABC transporter permease subunit [Thermodesulfobacteriota bacterium]